MVIQAMIDRFSLPEAAAVKAFSRLDLMSELESLAARVGVEILRRRGAEIEVTHKPDGSPVTAADHVAEEMIITALVQLTPEIPIIAEEDYTRRHNEGRPLPDISGSCFWLVDALDGTREFINGNDDFSVNIALIENNEPAMGVIYHPVSRVLYSGAGKGTAMRIRDGERQPIAASLTGGSLRIVSSSSFGNEIRLAKYLAGRQILEHRHRACSIKFCEVAEGRADLYPRFGPSREWDTAAGHAIVIAAGGNVSTSAGLPLFYGKPEFLNSDFVARGPR